MSLDRFGNYSADEREQIPPGMVKEREPKGDGRYIIFYTFEDEEEGEE